MSAASELCFPLDKTSWNSVWLLRLSQNCDVSIAVSVIVKLCYPSDIYQWTYTVHVVISAVQSTSLSFVTNCLEEITSFIWLSKTQIVVTTSQKRFSSMLSGKWKLTDYWPLKETLKPSSSDFSVWFSKGGFHSSVIFVNVANLFFENFPALLSSCAGVHFLAFCCKLYLISCLSDYNKKRRHQGVSGRA